jgi:hypothetical protein
MPVKRAYAAGNNGPNIRGRFLARVTQNRLIVFSLSEKIWLFVIGSRSLPVGVVSMSSPCDHNGAKASVGLGLLTLCFY